MSRSRIAETGRQPRLPHAVDLWHPGGPCRNARLNHTWDGAMDLDVSQDGGYLVTTCDDGTAGIRAWCDHT
ncbi:hypothetical protein L3i22_085570 [Actinoplanes sp. L3-i22]|nr:hypothetical protein L3i22_085570 [Actinoplanes sp. L3-i22]